jgi:uncharacterized membrane protein YjjP (DUF1212 family)
VAPRAAAPQPGEPSDGQVRAPQSSSDWAVEFLIRFTRAGHEAGYPTADLEDRVVALARALELEGVQVSATPTLVEVSLGSLPHQRTFTLRVRPAAVDLDAIARLDDLVHDVIEERADTSEADRRLAEIKSHPLERPWPLLLAAYGIAGAALTPVLGGGWREAAVAAIVGLIVGGVALPAVRKARTEPIAAPIAAIAASFFAALAVELGLNASPNVVTLAALVTFLPGMRLTIGMRELSSEHLQSGVANTANALVQLVGLVFGVEVGRSIAASWFGLSAPAAHEAGFAGWHLLAAVAAGLAFTLTLRAQFRDAWMMCAATVLALGANAAGAELVGAPAGVFVATLAVGLVGGLVGARLRRSPLVFIVPGVLMLVPGSAGFDSILQLLSNETVSGITAAFDTFVTATSIAYGLMVSAVILPGRFGVGGSAP